MIGRRLIFPTAIEAAVELPVLSTQLVQGNETGRIARGGRGRTVVLLTVKLSLGPLEIRPLLSRERLAALLQLVQNASAGPVDVVATPRLRGTTSWGRYKQKK